MKKTIASITALLAAGAFADAATTVIAPDLQSGMIAYFDGTSKTSVDLTAGGAPGIALAGAGVIATDHFYLANNGTLGLTGLNLSSFTFSFQLDHVGAGSPGKNMLSLSDGTNLVQLVTAGPAGSGSSAMKWAGTGIWNGIAPSTVTTGAYVNNGAANGTAQGVVEKHTYTITGDGSNFNFYFDGASMGSFAYTGSTIMSMTIGDVGPVFNADNLGVWNKALTATQVAAYNSLDFTTTYAVIPEPSTYALLGGLGALGVALVARRRKAR